MRQRFVSAGICTVVLASLLSGVDVIDIPCSLPVQWLAERLYGVSGHAHQISGIVGAILSCLVVGNNIAKSAPLLYLLLNEENIPWTASSETLGLLLGVLSEKYSVLSWLAVAVPMVSPLGFGRAVALSLRRRSAWPIAVAAVLAIGSFGWPARNNLGPALLSTDLVRLQSKGFRIKPGKSFYGEYGGKMGSGFRTVFATEEESFWRLYIEGHEGNPPPAIPLVSGMIVHLEHLESSEFLQTFDVASPLTITNQEVSCTPTPSEHSQFVLIREEGTPSLGLPIHQDSRFYLKHFKTGVFLTILQRKPVGGEGFEVNGEKATGKDFMRGPESSLWSSAANTYLSLQTFPQQLKDWLKGSLDNYSKLLRTSRLKIGRPDWHLSLPNTVFLGLFILAASRCQRYSDIVGHLIDLVLAYCFGQSWGYAFFGASIFGLENILPKPTRRGFIPAYLSSWFR
ncbi:hypothetical protein NEHOM01_0157 [Nematocida homosporus]|uniref:uncharacterized protein n=1 Tax=Nematocida homosporus TaxID=1912981 RepID=UPI002220D5D2|nr:uncharacterized protein NEHOM01_0157 [Nematocida homosporus]KAI5184412.1 hypothetical protein NEHOM01_0157 [Nematocida homosporus]